jgi:ribosomal protein S18 acetylase RimI-like enzyme
MNKLILSVGQQEVATEIANLLNSGGHQGQYMTRHSVLNNKVCYMVELDGSKVIGVIGIEQMNPRVSELKHLCVHKDYRMRGIGKKLLEKAALAAPTEFVYGMVRQDNTTNIRNNLRVGMRPIGKKKGRRGFLICFARRKNGNAFDRHLHT